MLELVEIVKYEIEIDKAITKTKPNITDVIDKVIETGNLIEEDFIISVDEEEESAIIIDKETGVVVDIWIDEEGNIKTEGSIVEDIANVVKPTIEYRIEPEEGTYGEEVKIIVTVKEEINGIAKIQFPDNSEKPYSDEKIVIEEYVVNENGRYKFIAESANGRKASKYIELKNAMSAGDIQLEVTNTNPTNKNVIIQAKYDENIKIGGNKLTNEDRFQYKIGEGTWETASANQNITVDINRAVYARYFDGTNAYKTTSVTVANIDKVAPVISSATSSTSWGKTNTVTLKATDTGTTGCATENYGIVGYGINQSNTTEPTYITVTAITSLSTTISNITENGTYYVWVKDKAGNTANKAVTVNRVDTTAPTTATISSSNVEQTTFSLTATGEDGENGIAKYEFYLNGTLEKTIETTEETATYKVEGKTAGQDYKYKVRVYNKAGNYTDSIEITVTTKTTGVEPETVAKIGDFVNYSVEVDGVTYDKWRILDFDNNGHMEIVCYNGPEFSLGSDDDGIDDILGSSTEACFSKAKLDYCNVIQRLNIESIKYEDKTYSVKNKARHLGSNPSNRNSYETINTSFVKFYGGNASSNSNYIYQLHHTADVNNVLLFDRDRTIEGYKIKCGSGGIWLASRKAMDLSTTTIFAVFQLMSDDTLENRAFVQCKKDGSNEGLYRCANLASVVSLESGIKINTSLEGNGSENSPWKLIK